MERLKLDSDTWQLKEFVGLDWVWRDSEKPDTQDVRWWQPATVPGCVMQDLWKAGKLPDPYFELNSKFCEWASARTWVYRRQFEITPAQLEQRATLCFEGIDYSAKIYLNGAYVASHTGMYTPCQIDVTGKLLAGENLLAVVVEPAPDEQPQVGKTSLTRTHKSRMTYWWDFCPRMIQQGIWDSVCLEFTGAARIEHLRVRAAFNADYSEASVTVSADCDKAENGLLQVTLAGQTKSVSAAQGATVTFVVENPRLWQPNGEGEPYEYLVQAALFIGDILSHQEELYYGLRDIRWLENPTREGREPYQLEVNGKKIFIHGSNWVPIDVFYGPRRDKKLNHLLEFAKRAGINMLRVWGGGLIERNDFYRLCAQKGIMVWQEFILSSSGIDNKTPRQKEFLEFMEQEAVTIVRKRRNQTALAVWCGGNELQDDSGMPLSFDDPLLAMLQTAVAQEDGTRRFLPTSPYGGLFLNSLENIEKQPDALCDVHGPWEHQGFGKHRRLYNAGTCQLHSEFGVEGMTNRFALDSTIAAQHQMPAGKDNEVYFHRGAWWTNDGLVNSMFGQTETVDQMRLASQFMQYEGLKYALERDKSRRPLCAGTFPWQFNEPYPNAFCTSNLDYYGQPKPAYYGVARTYRPYVAVAQFDSARLYGKDKLQAKLQLLTPGNGAEVEVRWAVHKMDGEKLTDGCYRGVANQLTCELGELDCPLQGGDALLLLRLQAFAEGAVYCNEYLFTTEESWKAMLHCPQASLAAAWKQGVLKLTNRAATAALWVHPFAECSREQPPCVYFSDNYFVLLPGETRAVEVACAEENNREKLRVEAFNVEEQRLLLTIEEETE